jgi:hypothetical protein
MNGNAVRKVFIGCSDVASLIHDFTVGFEALGVDVLSMVTRRYSVQGSRCDIDLDAMVPQLEGNASPAEVAEWTNRRASALQSGWRRALAECDTFLFLWSSTREDFADIAQLKRMGKRVVWWFVGDDSRWKSAYDQDMARYGLPPLHYDHGGSPQQLAATALRLRCAESMADVVVNTPSQCALALRPYYDALRSPLALDRHPHRPEQRERPVLLHAPSSAATKGSSQILTVLQELLEEGLDFDVRLLDQMSYAKALTAYEDVDILVGQIGAMTLGKQDRELMALGKVVVGGPAADEYPQRWPDDCPAVPALRPEQIKDALRALIPDVDRRRALAARGRAFVARQNDPATTCERLIEALEGRRQPDFVPTFFREHFRPESPEHVELYNLTTTLVQHTDWYQALVERGERDGLVF